jgi:uncharacterized cupredoxin-like copper-binding protein
VLGACGDDGHDEHSGGPAPASDGHTDHSHEGFQFGEAADASEATQTIDVTAKDFEFDPKEITVAQGDIVEFKVVNGGKQDHEFVIGDAALMEELGSMAHEHQAADVNAVPRLSPGDSGSLAWSFTEPGRFRFECHIDAHHKLGMTGTITVEG